jgi:fibulin 1/2
VDVSDEFRCRDVDECGDGDNGGCGHICFNVEGGHRCDCRAGFELDGDHR